jgi:hypothetical protein
MVVAGDDSMPTEEHVGTRWMAVILLVNSVAEYIRESEIYSSKAFKRIG